MGDSQQGLFIHLILVNACSVLLKSGIFIKVLPTIAIVHLTPLTKLSKSAPIKQPMHIDIHIQLYSYTLDAEFRA